jgi:uncharacterized membrane protein
MKRSPFLLPLGIAAAVLAAAALSLPALAEPIIFDNTQARDVASQLAQRYGVSIVFRGRFDTTTPVNVEIDDADGLGARLAAINALADSLGADFQKSFVISKMAVDETVPAPALDATATVYFPSTTLSAHQAIDLVAGVDDAATQYYGAIDGMVTMPSTEMGARDAAAEIARQTHTRWKAFYAIVPRGMSLANDAVIDQTANGQPVLEDPLVTFRRLPTAAEIAQQQADQEKAYAAAMAAEQKSAAAQQAQSQAAAQQYAANGMSPYGYGYNQGYNGYGDPGYGYGGYNSGYGYGGYGNGYDDGSGFDYGSGSGFGPPTSSTGGSGLSVGNGYGAPLESNGSGLDFLDGGGPIISTTNYGYVP